MGAEKEKEENEKEYMEGKGEEGRRRRNAGLPPYFATNYRSMFKL